MSIIIQYLEPNISPISFPKNEYEEQLIIHIVGRESLISQRTILRRALNIIPPHEPRWKEWFDLCDQLDKILGV